MENKGNSKFTIIPMAVKKKEDIIVNNNITLKIFWKMLGLKIASTGLKQHLDKITTKGNIALQELQRFINLFTKIKLLLVKTFMLPIMLSPILPLATISNKNIQKVQSLQNKALRFVYNQRYPYTLKTEELQELAILKPVHERAQKKWGMTNEQTKKQTRTSIFN